MQNLKEPILRAMNCVIVLQQGAPFAGWSDQYTIEDLQPAHARSYEPRAINTSTTVRIVRALMDYYRLTGDTKYLSGIPAALDFLESMQLPDSEVQRWGRPSRDPEAILVPRFVDPDDGRPLYVHRKGSNVVNGTYYIDQDITQTIGHYNSTAYINVKACAGFTTRYGLCRARKLRPIHRWSLLPRCGSIPTTTSRGRPTPATQTGNRQSTD